MVEKLAECGVSHRFSSTIEISTRYHRFERQKINSTISSHDRSEWIRQRCWELKQKEIIVCKSVNCSKQQKMQFVWTRSTYSRFVDKPFDMIKKIFPLSKRHNLLALFADDKLTFLPSNDFAAISRQFTYHFSVPLLGISIIYAIITSRKRSNTVELDKSLSLILFELCTNHIFWTNVISYD